MNCCAAISQARNESKSVPDIAAQGVLTLVRCRRRQGEIKRGALARRTFHPDPPAIALHDARDRCESDSYTWKFHGGMHALEGLKEPIRIRHVESDAVVANRKLRSSAAGHALNLDSGRYGLGC